MSQKKYSSLSPEVKATIPHVNVDDMVASLKYYVDEDFAHLSIRDQNICVGCLDKPCLYFCPVGVYQLDRQDRVMVSYQACVECGSCRVACQFQNIDWALPRGGQGVAYKFG